MKYGQRLETPKHTPTEKESPLLNDGLIEHIISPENLKQVFKESESQ